LESFRRSDFDADAHKTGIWPDMRLEKPFVASINAVICSLLAGNRFKRLVSIIFIVSLPDVLHDISRLVFGRHQEIFLFSL